MFDSFKKLSEKSPDLTGNQESYIAELEQRTTIPRLTHLYLTNRSSKYNESISSPKVKYAIATHVKKLNKKTVKETVSIEISYVLSLSNEKEMLMLALNTIEANSLIDFDVKAYEANEEQQADSVDLLFVIGEQITNKNEKETYSVNPTEAGMTFTQLGGFSKTWHKSSPIELISILSSIINSLEKLTTNVQLDVSMVTRLIDGQLSFDSNEIALGLYPKSLNKYLIFLFCLLLLLERWLVLNGSKFNE